MRLKRVVLLDPVDVAGSNERVLNESRFPSLRLVDGFVWWSDTDFTSAVNIHQAVKADEPKPAPPPAPTTPTKKR